MVTIRQATVDDAAAGAALHIACWREAYADIVDPDVLAELTSDLPTRAERWRDQIADGPPRWLGVDPSGQLVGFAAAGRGRDDDIDIELELFAIYVRAAQYGTGLGDRLIDVTIGDAPAYLWVLEANPRARAFYRRHGFEPDGVRKPEPRFRQVEVRLVRRGPPDGADERVRRRG